MGHAGWPWPSSGSPLLRGAGGRSPRPARRTSATRGSWPSGRRSCWPTARGRAVAAALPAGGRAAGSARGSCRRRSSRRRSGDRRVDAARRAWPVIRCRRPGREPIERGPRARAATALEADAGGLGDRGSGRRRRFRDECTSSKRASSRVAADEPDAAPILPAARTLLSSSTPGRRAGDDSPRQAMLGSGSHAAAAGEARTRPVEAD